MIEKTKKNRVCHKVEARTMMTNEKTINVLKVEREREERLEN
jgi:hypothetical protein